MTHIPRGTRLVGGLALAVLATQILSGCNFIPPEGPSQLDMRPKIESGPSAQRLGPDGYPLLGAFPRSAAAQLPDDRVVAERGQLKSIAGAQAATVTPGNPAYAASVTEALTVQDATRRDVDAAVSQARGTDGPLTTAADSDAILREIEGR